MRPDEFFSMTQTDAARAYLKKVGRATSIEQLLEGMKRGGAHVGGADPKNTLYVSLMRNPKQEFVKVGEGFIGLRDFYPGLPKPTKNGVRNRPAKRAPKRRRVRAVNRSSAAEKVEQPPRFPRIDKSQVHAAISKVLSDGHGHTAEDILKSVNREFGFEVKPIYVIGSLRGKAFEKLDGKYSLKK